MSEGLRPTLPTLLVSGCLALAACGGDEEAGAPEPAAAPATTATTEAPTTVRTAELESLLKRTLSSLSTPSVPATVYPPGGGPPEQAEYGGGRIKVRSVNCPEDIPVEKGGRFTCDVDARDATASVRVRQLDGEGRRMGYRATIQSEAAGGIPVETNLNGKLELE